MKPRSENEVGILYRMPLGVVVDGKDSTGRFKGVLKQRFSDFHVHEIDDLGNRVHMNSFKLPEEPMDPLPPPPPSDNEGAADDTSLLEWIPSSTKDEIHKLQLNSNEVEATKVKIEINVTSADKIIRTKIHRWLGTFDKLGSETIEKDTQKFIVISRQIRNDKRKATRRPHNRLRFTHCVLYKQGIDTTDAINYLSRKLRLHPRHISFAGTKDRQAKTVQRICFSNIEAKRLLQLNEYSTNSKLGNFSYQTSPLRLGQLKGNHFKILIRDVVTESESVISDGVCSLAAYGFINYFGLQRFGTHKISTHLVGKSLLQMNWIQAFDLILAPNESRDRSYMKRAKKLWLEDRDPIKALKEIPQHHMSIEASLIQGLSKHYATGDHWSAFSALQRNMRTLYFHSFQSYLWNHLASYRIKTFGLKPAIGDIVFADSSYDEALGENLEMSLEYDEIGNSDDGHAKSSETSKEGKKSLLPKFKLLTEEDLGNYVIFDIVIPIEGSEIKIPDSCNLKPFWDKLLEDNGIEQGFPNFRPRSELPKGSVRRLLEQPMDATYQILRYNENDDLDKFILSDYDLMVQKEKEEQSVTVDQVEEGQGEKDKTCVIVEFSLRSSSYATVALREILDTEQVTSEEEAVDENSSQCDKRKREEGETEAEEVEVESKKSKNDVGHVTDELPNTSSRSAGDS